MDSDPGRLRERVSQATGRLLATAVTLSDSQARAASLLPGWSRGHVLSHIARNADGLRNLLIWARTSVETPQYPSRQARDQAIDAGAGRPASELVADLRASADAFGAEAAVLDDSAWQAIVSSLGGPSHPAWVVLWKRLSEVQIHHVDLGAGYQPADWPDQFVADGLEVVTAQFAAAARAPAAVLSDSGSARSYEIGLAGADGHRAAEPQYSVAGPGRALLAWLTGRSAGAGLTAEPGGQLPAMPAW